MPQPFVKVRWRRDALFTRLCVALIIFMAARACPGVKVRRSAYGGLDWHQLTGRQQARIRRDAFFRAIKPLNSAYVSVPQEDKPYVRAMAKGRELQRTRNELTQRDCRSPSSAARAASRMGLVESQVARTDRSIARRSNWGRHGASLPAKCGGQPTTSGDAWSCPGDPPLRVDYPLCADAPPKKMRSAWADLSIDEVWDG